MRHRVCLPLAALLLTALAVAPTTAGTPARSESTSPCGRTSAAPTFKHVVWVVMENRDLHEFLGSPDAPYFNGLAEQCGVAAEMRAITHPSLPNYIALTSGRTHGITDGDPPSRHKLAGNSIFRQLGPGGWRTLAESMPANCHRRNSGNYVPRHNPATYFTNIRSQCREQDVPLSSGLRLSAPFTLVVPNQIHNTHDSSVAVGDDWLATFLPRVFGSSAYRKGRTAVFVTFDEAEDQPGNGNRIVTLVAAPSTTPGTMSDKKFTHYSLLRTTQELLGLRLLGNARTATSMRSTFRLGASHAP